MFWEWFCLLCCPANVLLLLLVVSHRLCTNLIAQDSPVTVLSIHRSILDVPAGFCKCQEKVGRPISYRVTLIL